MTLVSKITVLLLGYEIIPKTVSTRDRGARFVMSEPICAYLIETERGFVLFDTGVNVDNIRDPVRRESLFMSRGWLAPPIVLPEHDFLAQLSAVGVSPAAISDVVLSHVHCDHTGNLKHLRHARIWIQRLEHEFAFSNHGNLAVFNDDFDFPDMKWQIVDGDWELMPGIEGVYTRGHMPGHQSLVVTLPKGGVKVLTADAGDLWENFEDEVLPGESCDDVAALASIRKLKAIAEARSAELILLHDPVRVQTLRLAPEFYD
ncbi:N-acyl homoserine lactone hydrolase [Mycoplana sp. BE70]|uniref:N-acyl homoserine lactonase family protein n=1 Tax=Mycoplana sp. BE70 TaxID=2817775 RepID=UPI002858C9C5|nr:N-acyl homoserine lactonase family protein [Mycoplana sp. BE70]MDR6755127.1 N-acyl homoserine lactone hydrolase [Mycoplana sp. BE70]